MPSYTETLTQTMSLARRHARIGYALYIAGQPVTACQNDDQRRGYYNARLAELAAADAETEAYLSNPSRFRGAGQAVAVRA